MRVHGRLARFVAWDRRDRSFELAFDGTPAIKDPIESTGVPHTEVGGLLVDGASTTMAQRVRGGESVDVWPLDRQSAGTPPRFVLDVHLGRLASYLRLLGIDTAWRNDADDDALVATSNTERRTLLTRDVALLKQSDVDAGAFVYAMQPLEQLVEIEARFALAPWFAALSRCSHCNSRVEPADPEQLGDAVPPRARASATSFSRCTGCGRAYWLGSHAPRLFDRLARAGIHLPSIRTDDA